jgi:hypothetical protein
VCDDGNNTTETSCNYGTATCNGCDATCGSNLSLTGPTCGDRSVNGPEVCDDGNTSTCGSCNATCSAVQLKQATGSMGLTLATYTSNSLVDGETFSLFDGINTTVIFEFDKVNGLSDPSRVRINVANVAGNPLTADQVATNIMNAINGTTKPLEITASIVATNLYTVVLTHDQPGRFGNHAVTEAVASNRFAVSGMTGGTGYDCAEGIGCTRNEDCERGLACMPDGTCGAP